jgi:hypothetical protein
MAFFGTLGFLASYELLRRQSPRIVAAAICPLLISSRIHFELITRLVFPYAPYLLASTGALLIARKLEKATKLTSLVGWGTLLVASILASLMLASAGIALLGAIAASIVVAFFQDRGLAFRRLKIYLAVFLIGIGVQGFWMHQPVEASAGISAQEWPVQGFPHSYLSQLKVKDGHYPELGLAKPADIPVRILKNAYESCYLLAHMILRRTSYITWMSLVVAGPLLLIVLGWISSTWPKGGGIQEWYFAGYEAIYLCWPWNTEPRFFLPVAPLACLYAWRGVRTLVFLVKKNPRLVGAVWLPFAVILTIGTWLWMTGVPLAGHLSHGGLQDEASFTVWLLSGIFAAWMIWAGTTWMERISALVRPAIGRLRMDSLRISQVLALAALVGLIVVGLTQQLQMGRANLDLNSNTNRPSPEAEAGAWINSHTDPSAVVMARQVPSIYHYARRKVIWFPPSSDPQLLMQGILDHKVDFLVVVQRQGSYYLPRDDDSFAPLIASYPNVFRLVCQAPDFRIFRVAADPSLPSRHANGLHLEELNFVRLKATLNDARPHFDAGRAQSQLGRG